MTLSDPCTSNLFFLPAARGLWPCSRLRRTRRSLPGLRGGREQLRLRGGGLQRLAAWRRYTSFYFQVLLLINIACCWKVGDNAFACVCDTETLIQNVQELAIRWSSAVDQLFKSTHSRWLPQLNPFWSTQKRQQQSKFTELKSEHMIRAWHHGKPHHVFKVWSNRLQLLYLKGTYGTKSTFYLLVKFVVHLESLGVQKSYI